MPTRKPPTQITSYRVGIIRYASWVLQWLIGKIEKEIGVDHVLVSRIGNLASQIYPDHSPNEFSPAVLPRILNELQEISRKLLKSVRQ